MQFSFGVWRGSIQSEPRTAYDKALRWKSAVQYQ